VVSPRTLHTARTALWITCGWIGAALLVHWVVRRVPTHLARELTATATGAAIGLASAWFELRLIPRHVRSLTVGGLLLARTFFSSMRLSCRKKLMRKLASVRIPSATRNRPPSTKSRYCSDV